MARIKWIVAAAIGGGLLFGDWIAGLAWGVLALCWVLLSPAEGPPVLAFGIEGQPMRKELRP